MPAKSDKQRKFMGAELGRLRAGKETKTHMTEEQLEDFARKSLIKGIDDFIERKSILSRIKTGNKPGEKVIVPTHLNKNPFDIKKQRLYLENIN